MQNKIRSEFCFLSFNLAFSFIISSGFQLVLFFLEQIGILGLIGFHLAEMKARNSTQVFSIM